MGMTKNAERAAEIASQIKIGTVLKSDYPASTFELEVVEIGDKSVRLVRVGQPDSKVYLEHKRSLFHYTIVR